MLSKKEKCLESSGFLTLHRCDRDAVQHCTFCGKPVCEGHGPRLQSGQISCITCMRERGEKPGAVPDAAGKSGNRKAADTYDTYYPGMYYGTYYDNYHPFSLDDHHFTEKDHSALVAEAPDKGQYEAGFEGS